MSTDLDALLREATVLDYEGALVEHKSMSHVEWCQRIRLNNIRLAAAMRASEQRARENEKDAARYRWQPIASAPKDNNQPLLLAYFTESGELNGFDWDGEWLFDPGMNNPNGYEPSYWYWASAFGTVEEPTHWMYQPDWFSAIAASEGK